MAIGIAYPTQANAVPQNCTIGFLDYNDSATVGTPLVVLAGVPKVLTNDELGAQTNKSFLAPGVTDIWLAGTDVFDWSQLKLGDMVDIRLAVEVITSSVNTDISIDLHLGTGAGSYVIPFFTDESFKDATTHPLNRYNGIYMGDTNTLDNGGQFKITSDKDCTATVIGWYCKVLIRD